MIGNMDNYDEAGKNLDSDFPWTVINAYFSNAHLEQLVRHQTESYNDFIGRKIPHTINMFNPVSICSEHDYDKNSGHYALEILITFENFGIYRPQIHENNGATKLMFPQEARLRNFTYASNMTVTMNIKYIIRTGENLENIQTIYKVLPKIHIGKIPIMLRSSVCVLTHYKHMPSEITGECKMDPGGYFIINGSEKTCLGQERAAENTIYCFDITKNNSKWSYIAEIKSVPDWRCISPKQISIMISQKSNSFGNSIFIQIPRLKMPIPIVIIFRALGVLSDKEICKKILLDIEDPNNKIFIENLRASIVEANNYTTQEAALKYITGQVIYTPLNMDKEMGQKKKREFALDVLTNDLYPHCHNKIQQIYFLGHMTFKLLKCYNKLIPCDDRDSYLNKRIDLTGTLLNNLFRNYFNKLVKDMQKQIIREINNGSWKSTEDYANIINLTNIYKIVKSTTIENGFKRALATGDFGIKQTNSNKVGVAQVLNRLTYISSLSHLRRCNTPIDKSGKLIPPRKLHNTTWGFLCPAECFDPETPILMWNGTIKRAGDININDILIDDNGNPTKIRSTCSGQKNMYDIIPDKSNFIKHRVTDNHILTLHIRQHKKISCNNRKNRPKRFIVKFFDRVKLKITEKSFQTINDANDFIAKFTDDDTIDITIEDYLKLNKNTQKHLVLFKTNEINWEKKEVSLDPYLLGMWLGDGLSVGTGFALNYKTDFETLEYWESWAKNNGAIITKGKRYDYSIISQKNKEASDVGLCNRVEEAPLKKHLKKYNLINNKHIPNDYLTNDRETRLKVLAGLIDTDGNVRAKGAEIRICQGPKNYRVVEDAHLLATSLGFSCGIKEGQSQWTDIKSGIKKFSSYKELTITGNRIYEIPTLLSRKKLNKIIDNTLIVRSKEFKCSLFKLEEVGIGEYVGWQLEDKRGRFLLSDGMVVHNTPEGQSVGVVKNISYLATITVDSNSQPIQEYVNKQIIPLDEAEDIQKYVKVFINGAWIGITKDPIQLYNSLKEKKHKGIINIYTSIVFNYKTKEIIICNDAGRLIRPVLKVKNNKILLTRDIVNKLKSEELQWDDLLSDCKIDESIIEYIDPREQNASLIAMKTNDMNYSDSNFIRNYTHCEIHPSTIFGILASCIPFPEHNQAPRLTYQCAMGKQAMGVYVTNYNSRMDKTAYVHTYGMRPLVDTQLMNLINLHSIPSGAQVVVAIMTYTGYNQEDSILFNKSSIERGLFQATIYHTEKDEDKKIHGDQEIRCKPDKTKTKCMKFGNYNKVNDNGVIPEDTLVEDRDIIIAKVLPIKENRNNHTKVIKYEDQSRIYRTKEETYIDKNFIERNGDGYNFAKIRLRTLRQPVIGDKFSSRHGQKGTIGNIIPEENMPFTADGLRPDIIINPHAIPSRMTIGQLKETTLGKVLLELGLFGDGTSFGELDIKDICKELQKVGYESMGNELLYDGLNGEQIASKIFMGPAFYQRLKHMVNDKQHSRSIGPMVNLTRQPAEGRSRDGGLRYGEMEKDAMVAHGASKFNKGRLYDASDAFSVHICKKCGLIAAYNNEKHIHICKTCDNKTDFNRVELPYSCKLLFQELITMNIAPRIMT
jgi:DNA-directed RNA polymerase beta subunit